MLAKEMLAELHEQLSDQAQGEDGNIPREQYRHILGQRFSEEQMASIADKINCGGLEKPSRAVQILRRDTQLC